MEPDDQPKAPPPPTPSPSATVPTCIACGYELTGLRVEGTCPECGAAVWQPATTHDPYMALSTTSLVCGILSLVTCFVLGPLSFFPGLVGVITGEIAASKYKRSTIRSSGRGLAIAGRITSWIGVALGIGFIAVLLLML